MPIVLTALPRPIRDCLGCRDCTGLCWSVIELHRIPDAVLHPPRTPSP